MRSKSSAPLGSDKTGVLFTQEWVDRNGALFVG